MMPTVEYELDARGVCRLWLSRPERLNAVNPELVEDLAAALDRAIRDDARVAVLAGRGRAFCAGHDLKHETPPDQTVFEWRRVLHLAQEITRLVRRAPFPVIAAVHGYALGAGSEFALCCDLIVAAEGATFGFPEVSVGQSPTQGISHVLPTAIGYARAKELVLFSERFTAARALELGLINRVVSEEDLDAAVDEYVERLLAQPAMALALAKVVIDQGPQHTLDAALELEIAHSMLTHGSEDEVEAEQSFRKRS